MVRHLLACALVVALCVALVGCAGESGKSEEGIGYSSADPAGAGVTLTIKVYQGGSVRHYDERDYKVQVTFLSVVFEPQAGQLVPNNSADLGYTLVAAKVRLECLSGPESDGAYYVSSYGFDTISSSGQNVENYIWSFEDESLELGGELYPGDSTEGWLVFQVPKDDPEPMAAFGRRYDGTGGLWFKLY